MEVALYGPGGYYTGDGRTGPRGDYFTSPYAHPAFGALIAVQLRDFWLALGSPASFVAVEFGAGGGLLAEDVTSYAHGLDEAFARSLSYVTHDLAAGSIDLSTLAGMASCVLSNELLDAMPVHRFTVSGGLLQELYVTLRGGKFIEELGEPSTPEIAARLNTLAQSLPDGYRGEVNPGIGPWAHQVTSLVHRGFVLTVDYGHDRPVLYSPERSRGTLRSYYRHTLGGNPFDHVGDQDLTAHVDFTAVDEALGAEGFAAIGSTSQREFLYNLDLPGFQAQSLPPEDVAGMQSLIDPEGLGAFRVVVHSKGVDAQPVAGLTPHLEEIDRTVLPLPLLQPGSRHIRQQLGRDTSHSSKLPTWEQLFSEE